MARDPLAPLLRLRALEVAAARRDLVARQAGAAAAEDRAAAARSVLETELGATIPGFADSLAAWLPAARAARDRAAGEAMLANQAVDGARAALAAQRARERAVEWLVEKRRAEAQEAAAHAAQKALDEAAQRRGVRRAA